MSQSYFTNIGGSGPVRYGQFPFAIGVLESPNNFMPIGMAFEIGWTEHGLAVWRLTIGETELPDRWVLIDRRFVAVKDAPT
jgi:hypothetical protein